MSRWGRLLFETEAEVDRYLARFAKQVERDRPVQQETLVKPKKKAKKLQAYTPPQMSEKKFQSAVLKLAKLRGWR